jgi:hypothetical protein
MRSQARALGLDSTGTLHSPWRLLCARGRACYMTPAWGPRPARRLIRALLLPSDHQRGRVVG